MTTQGPKGLRQIGELAQIVACKAVKSEALGSLPTGGTGYLLFSHDSVESTEFISI